VKDVVWSSRSRLRCRLGLELYVALIDVRRGMDEEELELAFVVVRGVARDKDHVARADVEMFVGDFKSAVAFQHQVDPVGYDGLDPAMATFGAKDAASKAIEVVPSDDRAANDAG
jgi:hypothetical protein